MENNLPDIVTLRLNFDVHVFRGHTRQEMMVIAVVSLSALIILFGSLAKIFFGFFLVGVGLSFPISIPLGWLLAVILQKQKADKPKGHIKQCILFWLEDSGFYRSPFIRYSGKWLVRRKFL